MVQVCVGWIGNLDQFVHVINSSTPNHKQTFINSGSLSVTECPPVDSLVVMVFHIFLYLNMSTTHTQYMSLSFGNYESWS